MSRSGHFPLNNVPPPISGGKRRPLLAARDANLWGSDHLKIWSKDEKFHLTENCPEDVPIGTFSPNKCPSPQYQAAKGAPGSQQHGAAENPNLAWLENSDSGTVPLSSPVQECKTGKNTRAPRGKQEWNLSKNMLYFSLFSRIFFYVFLDNIQ